MAQMQNDKRFADLGTLGALGGGGSKISNEIGHPPIEGDHILDADGQVTYAAANRVKDGVGDGRLDSSGAQHADAFDSARQVRINLVNHRDIELRHIATHRAVSTIVKTNRTLSASCGADDVIE